MMRTAGMPTCPHLCVWQTWMTSMTRCDTCYVFTFAKLSSSICEFINGLKWHPFLMVSFLSFSVGRKSTSWALGNHLNSCQILRNCIQGSAIIKVCDGSACQRGFSSNHFSGGYLNDLTRIRTIKSAPWRFVIVFIMWLRIDCLWLILLLSQLFEGIYRATNKAVTSKQFLFLLHLFEFIASSHKVCACQLLWTHQFINHHIVIIRMLALSWCCPRARLLIQLKPPLRGWTLRSFPSKHLWLSPPLHSAYAAAPRPSRMPSTRSIQAR